MSQSQNGKRIARIHKKDPRCYWCKCVTIITPCVPGKPDPHNRATIDHLVTRYQIERGVFRPFVLSCWKCNNDRAANDPTDPAIIERHATLRHAENILFRLQGLTGRMLDIPRMVAAVEKTYEA